MSRSGSFLNRCFSRVGFTSPKPFNNSGKVSFSYDELQKCLYTPRGELPRLSYREEAEIFNCGSEPDVSIDRNELRMLASAVIPISVGACFTARILTPVCRPALNWVMRGVKDIQVRDLLRPACAVFIFHYSKSQDNRVKHELATMNAKLDEERIARLNQAAKQGEFDRRTMLLSKKDLRAVDVEAFFPPHQQ